MDRITHSQERRLGPRLSDLQGRESLTAAVRLPPQPHPADLPDERERRACTHHNLQHPPLSSKRVWTLMLSVLWTNIIQGSLICCKKSQTCFLPLQGKIEVSYPVKMGLLANWCANTWNSRSVPPSLQPPFKPLRMGSFQSNPLTPLLSLFSNLSEKPQSPTWHIRAIQSLLTCPDLSPFSLSHPPP